MPKRIFWLLMTAVFPIFIILTIPTLPSLAISSTVLIDAVLYDGLEANDPDEAVRLRNVSDSVVSISNWQIYDGVSKATIPGSVDLAPGQAIWLTKDGAAFTRQFGFLPDFEVTDSNLSIPNLSGSWPGYANTGDEVILLNETGTVIDVVVYESGNAIGQEGWSGTAVYPYSSGLLGQAGQILYRKRDQVTGLPVPDTDTAADWAQEINDPVNGRKPRYPGWDLDEFFFTTQVTETAVLTIAIAPDNAYEAVVNEINKATTSLHIESHTFENIAISEALIQAAQRGVSVTILLEGAPPGGLPDQEKYICEQIEMVNGRCWFMISDDTHDPKIFDRYTFIHAKFILIDNQRVIISSENLSPNSMPSDDKTDGTWGRRGVILITDAPSIVNHVQTIFDHDFDITHHHDITGTTYIGPPPIGFIPNTQTGGITYSVRYTTPATFTDNFAFELVQSPENSLRDQDSLLGLINKTNSGDTVLIQQLSEPPDWGDNPTDDPNPRLEAYINAARRGATVKLLLDAYFNDTENANSNSATCQYVNAIAQDEKLKLECALSNPTGLGIHNKMILAQISGQGYIHIGSINGSEQSSKGNRELALQVQSDSAYTLLSNMFYRDWPYRVYLPTLLNNYIGPANHILISEILYDSPGYPDDAEFVELANPTAHAIDLSSYSLGDAVNRSDFEDVRRFPSGTTIAARSALLIATTATGFKDKYGINPDFEILETDSSVPNLIDDPSWGNTGAYLQLGNTGDEVILRNPSDQVIDIVTYGNGSYPGITACPLVVITNASLERLPYWRDTDDCTADFRENALPTPGTLSE